MIWVTVWFWVKFRTAKKVVLIVSSLVHLSNVLFFFGIGFVYRVSDKNAAVAAGVLVHAYGAMFGGLVSDCEGMGKLGG